MASESGGGFRRLGHVPALNGLRGLAVLLVMLDHTETILLPKKVEIDAGPVHGAFLGVDIFFVLSGFLITSLLLGEQNQRGRVGFGGFYRRRAFRLLPALWVMLAVHVVYTLVTGLPWHPEWVSVRGALLYVSNWTWKWDGLVGAPGLGHLWSLSIEEQFYLLWPAVLVLVFGIRRRGSVVVVGMVALIAAVVIRRAVMWNDGTSWFFLFLRTDTRADSLLVGALLAQLWVRRRTIERGLPVVAWIGVVVLTFCVLFGKSTGAFLNLGGYTLVAVATAAIILGATDSRWIGSQVLSWRPLAAVGVVSYGLYLWHMPVFYVVNRYGDGLPDPIEIVVAVGISVAITLASWRFIERPFLARRHPKQPQPIPVPEAAEGA